jgi:hypothetical protein
MSPVEILNKIVERDVLNGEALIELGKLLRLIRTCFPSASTATSKPPRSTPLNAKALIAHGPNPRARKPSIADGPPPSQSVPLCLKAEQNLEDYTARVERAAKSQG